MRCLPQYVVCFLVFFSLFTLKSYAAEISTLPMYGGVEKSAEQKLADQTLIESIKKQGLSLHEASRKAGQSGFTFLQQQKDFTTAIKRFNQAWLLDPDNGDAYYGFAMVSWLRDNNTADAERFFRMALDKKNADNSVLAAYAQFLFKQEKYTDVIPHLELLLKKYPAAKEAAPLLAFAYAKKGDHERSCHYAQQAITNQEKLLAGRIEDYCRS